MPRSIGPLRPYPVTLSGEATPSKLSRIRQVLSNRAGTAEWVYILPTLPAIAWLLNYRCPTDIPFVPVAYAYLVLTPTTCVIFVDQRKVQDEELKARFIVEGIQVQDYGVYAVGQYVKSFIAETTEKQDGKTSVTVWAPPECNWALYQACSPVERHSLLSEYHLDHARSSLRRKLYHVLWTSQRRSRTLSNNRAFGTLILGTDGPWYVSSLCRQDRSECLCR